jgi:hypothetical protein
LNKEENIETDVAKIIAESVFNNLSTNIRECVRIARLVGNDVSKVAHLIEIFTRYYNNDKFKK